MPSDILDTVIEGGNVFVLCICPSVMQVEAPGIVMLSISHKNVKLVR